MLDANQIGDCQRLCRERNDRNAFQREGKPEYERSEAVNNGKNMRSEFGVIRFILVRQNISSSLQHTTIQV